MKIYKLLLIAALGLIISSKLIAANIEIEEQGWKISYDASKSSFQYTYKGTLILEGAYPQAKYDIAGIEDIIWQPQASTAVTYTSKSINDNFGTGTQYTIEFKEVPSEVTMEQNFYFYEGLQYFITDVSLVAGSEIKSNYLSPMTTESSFSILPKSADNRMLFVPWDNDGFIRYESNKLSTEKISYGVTSVYNAGSRIGFVVGAIEHDTWKSAIRIKASGNEKIDEFCCYSGASSNITRDKLPHGKVKGNRVRSSKMFVGYFDDWRMGMEAYGHANTLIVPARTTWTKGTPFGWNSWGALQEKITYNSINEVSEFYKNELYDKGFHNEQGVVIIDLDSFWDNLSTYRLIQFAQKCKERGQVPGIYWCPFSHWFDDLESYVEGTNNKYKFKECVLYLNGVAHKQGGYCVDPTHPAIKERIDYQFAKFKEWGYEYVKLDFVTNAGIQADSYYNPEVTTGVQAYNEGFQYLLDAAGDDIFLALSIAPIFPYQYGNSRRISCDSWGQIGHTEYSMNSLSYGWWTDQFYQFNDPDHLVLQGNDATKESEGANRARVTSGAITGMMLFGDNFSLSDNSGRGNAVVSQERALKYMTNADINEMARLGVSFMPVYGNQTDFSAEYLFMHHTDEYLYIACINYYSSIRYVSGTIPLDYLGLEEKDIESIKELWSGDNVELKTGGFAYSVPPCDARVYRIKKKSGGLSIATDTKEDKIHIYLSSPGNISVTSTELINKLEVYNVQGQLLNKSLFTPNNAVDIKISPVYKGLALVKCYLENMEIYVKKLLI